MGVKRAWVKQPVRQEEKCAVNAPGSYAGAGDPAWSDYRLSVLLRSEADAIGVMARYRDPDNYYRFSMDRERRYRRPTKKAGGRATVLCGKIPFGTSVGGSTR